MFSKIHLYTTHFNVRITLLALLTFVCFVVLHPFNLNAKPELTEIARTGTPTLTLPYIKQWSSVSKLVKERQSKVKQCFIQGYASYYGTASARRKVLQNWKDVRVADSAPFPMDGNLMQGFSWFVDGAKWRLDLRRVYPSIGHDFMQSSFDGEKYYVFDEAGGSGQVRASRDDLVRLYGWSKNEFTTFSESTMFGGALIPYIEEFVSPTSAPSYAKNEIVNGMDCEKYIFQVHPAPSYTTAFEVWFARKQSAIVKVMHKDLSPNGDGQSVCYSATDFKAISGIFMPFKVKTELYRIRNNKYEWLTTRLYVADQIQINDRNSVSAFQHPIRVTAHIEDQLSNPGTLKMTGGITTEAVEQIKVGIPPKLEEPNAIPNGEAPEVSKAQEEEEVKASGLKRLPSAQ